MNDKPVPITALPGDFVAPDDVELFTFVNSLRGSVRARVAASQQRGLPLADIVVEVREMVRLAENDPELPTRFSSRAYRAIARQAVAWCIESYQPTAFTAGHDFVADTPEWDPKCALHMFATAPDAPEAAAVQSPVK